MSKYQIFGGKKLNGTLEIDACKNSILPIIAGSVLCKGVVKLNNCPLYSDVIKMCDILKTLGSVIDYYQNTKTLILDNTNLEYQFISNELTKDIRASIFTLGPMLARFKKAKISYPGGCQIGQRGISTHINSFEQLGVEVLQQHGYMYCKCKNINQKEIYLDIPSVGATENLMMFMCSSFGKFKIKNAAKEPEIVDLQNFLNKMGAKISGAGTDTITIIGVEKFSEVEYTPLADRIITGTMLIAGAITGGNITLKNCNPNHVGTLIDILKKSGCKISKTKNSIHLICNKKLKSFGKIETLPYPGFATDLQSQITTLACICSGVSLIKENIFECRFRYVPELIKMGAKIKVNGNIAIVEGKDELFGAEVYAPDLRGGVALVLAGLIAKGYTTVNEIKYIERGYYKLEEQLSKLGADIQKID
ncbi:MAG: UDP-N-acetylglucosamine 1-carboxyvinyltransferase [Clostridiales bacterium]|nr:UDP-N-acetylglucosamine 1-carboxyvinyltransferase [Clostridiales bacterium]